MLYFATFFDINYLSRGIILTTSLQKYHANYTLYLLCLDDDTKTYFEKNKVQFPQIVPIDLIDIEKHFPELEECKNNRSVMEYYFTLSPILPLFLLDKYKLPYICTLDADIKFYSSPEKIFQYLEEYSIIITPHKFSKINEKLIIYGKNNVSFQIFKNDEIGIKCLYKWKEQCSEWCCDILDEKNNRFADQKYLDSWETDYANKVKILDDSTTGIAPWNLNNYIIKKEGNSFYSNNERIIFIHFHHFKLINKYWATNGFQQYQVNENSEAQPIYFDYWQNLKKINQKLQIESKNIRNQSIVSDRQKIRSENSIFINPYSKLFFSIKINKLPGFLLKILFKIYA